MARIDSQAAELKAVQVFLPERLHREIRILALKTGKPVAAIYAAALTAYLNSQGNKDSPTVKN